MRVSRVIYRKKIKCWDLGSHWFRKLLGFTLRVGGLGFWPLHFVFGLNKMGWKSQGSYIYKPKKKKHVCCGHFFLGCNRLMSGHVIVSIVAYNMFNIYPMLIEIWISSIFQINMVYFFDEIGICKYYYVFNVNHMPNWNINLFRISNNIWVS